MKRRARIIVEYLAAFTGIVALLLAIGGVVLVKFYGEELQDFVMEQVNERLDSTIDVEEVSVKVFHKFPNTSLLLEDITIWSSHNFTTRGFNGPGADTLLTAQSLSLSFNMFSLITKKFNVRKLEIKQGEVHFYTDQEGNGNYVIFTREKKKRKNDPLINLTQLRIEDFRIILNNQAKQLLSSSDLKRLDLNGRLSKRNTQIRGTLAGHLKEISNKGILYASDRNIEAKLNLNVQDSLYTIRSGQLQIDRILADMDGHFVIHRGQGAGLDLYADARNLEIHEVLDLLPSQLSKPLQEIQGSGKLELYTRITGMVSSTLTPKIEADFQTTNANLKWDRFPFTLGKLNLTGTYSNGGEFNPVTTSLNIKTLSAQVGEDQLSGRGRIHNFYDPDFEFELKGDIHPEQWLEWYETIPLHQASGILGSNLKVSGSYDRLKPKGEKFLAFDVSGTLSLREIDLEIRKGGPAFRDVNGLISITNDFWEPTLSGLYGKSDFQITGSGLNLISFLLGEEETLVASAALRSQLLDLQDILDGISRQHQKEKRALIFPEKLDLRLTFILDEFHKDKFEAKHVRGIALFESPSFFLDSLSMQTMEGTLTGSLGGVQYANGTVHGFAEASLYKLDIQQLFYSFHNFGQKQLTSEHLKGSVSGSSNFSANFDSTIKIQIPSIKSESSLTIRDGELNAFSPLLALSRFIEVDELQNIQFHTLENNILIKDNQVIIPVMDIRSNALDLSASGTHGFDNRYDYRLKLKLSDLLYNKTKESKRREFEVAADESDTRTVFLKIHSDGSEAFVELDREKTAQKIRQDMREEKSELKQILNEELGLFKNDKELQEQKKKPEETQEIFKFEFSEEETDSVPVPSRTKRRGLFRKKDSKKDSVQNKPADKFVIDE
jgi:hypothetical protein